MPTDLPSSTPAFAISPGDVLRTLRNQKSPALLVAVAVMGLVTVGLILCPRAYQSEAKLNVRVGRESIGLDPTATTTQTISVSDTREFEMNSVMDVIDSRAVRERVVDALGPDAILTGRPIPELVLSEDDPPASDSPEDLATRIRRDKAVRALADQIKTSAGRRSSVITITAKATTPELAQKILKSFLESFHAVHLNASRATGSYEFFDEQCRLLAQQLAEATGELTAKKDSLGLATLEGRQKTLEDQVSALQASSQKNAASLASVDATIAALKRSIADLPERLVTLEVSGFPDDSIGVTRKHLTDLRLKEQDLLTKFTNAHPQVIAVRQQITTAESMISGRGENAQQSTRSSNPTREALHLRLLTEEATGAALRAEAESLRSQSQQIRSQLAALNGQDADITRLQQRVDVLKAGLKTYTEKLEQSRIDHALADERISNVSVVQPASWSPKPVSPKKSLVLFFGAVAAVITGIGTAFAREYLPRWTSRQTDPPTAVAV